MGCGSCGTGKPNGCKSNGGCSTGGCNRLNVHDWLMNLPFSDPESSCRVVEVSFKQGSRKEYYRNPTLQYFEKGEYVTVEGVSGFDVGEVSLTGELVRLQLKKRQIDEFSPEMKKILRKSKVAVEALFDQSKSALLCSHRPALPTITQTLASHAKPSIKDEILGATTLNPAEFVVLRMTMGKNPKFVAIERWGL